MTRAQRNLIKFAATIASNARAELGSNTANGASARPTVAQLNRTLERLASIEQIIGKALEGEPGGDGLEHA